MPTTQCFVHAPIITYTNQHICIISPIQDWGPEVKGHLIHVCILNAKQATGHKVSRGCLLNGWFPFSNGWFPHFICFTFPKAPSSPHHDQFSHQIQWLFHFSNRDDSYSFLSHLYFFFSFRLIFPKSSQDIATFTSQYYLKLQSKPTFFSNPFKPLPSQTSFSPRAYYFYECHHYVLSHALHLWFDPFVWILCIEVTAGSPISTFHYHFHDHYSNSGTCLPSPGTLYICLLIDLPACSLVFYESPISLKCIIITSISRDFNLTDSEKCLELSFSISTSGESNGPGITFWKAYLQRQLPNL